jgi:crotonobetainyl-CoA:carnitine CoA-transferase CaiB-like acyl-CoA transferase
MVAPLDGLPFVCAGTGEVGRAAAQLLEALGADVVQVDTVHSRGHAAQIAALEPIGAIDGAAPTFSEHGVFEDPPFAVVRLATIDAAAAWAASGALALTGPAERAPLPMNPRLAVRLLAAGAVAQLLAACREVELDVDPLALLGERAAFAGFGRQGSTSVGGNCHLVEAADGWVALNLARADDVALLPALLDGAVEVDAPWTQVLAAVRRCTRAQLDARAALLGFPLGAVPDRADRSSVPRSPFVIGREQSASRTARLRPTTENAMAYPASRAPLVVDLSSLWAGPLAASLLRDTGARVIKVESLRRPDGARRGPAAFYDVLNYGKECLALEFDDASDRAVLVNLLERADVVIEGSRPRAMQQLGIDAHAIAQVHGTTWISITGHGRGPDAAARVAFGDDAAAAAGLVVGRPPNFVGDAIADPITGLYATCAALAALVGRRGQVIDVALVRCAAFACGGDGEADQAGLVHAPGAPHARHGRGPAFALGAHTAQLRAEFGATSSLRE